MGTEMAILSHGSPESKCDAHEGEFWEMLEGAIARDEGVRQPVPKGGARGGAAVRVGWVRPWRLVTSI